MKQLGIGAHIETSGFKRCKQFSFELISFFEKNNPKTNYGSLFISAKMKAVYTNWKDNQARIGSVQGCCQDTKYDPAQSVDSASRVLAQPIGAEDIHKKREIFLTEAEEHFKKVQTDQEGVSTKIAIENCDIAALKFSFTMDSPQEHQKQLLGIFSEPTSPLLKGLQSRGSKLLKKGSVAEENFEPSFKEKLEMYIKGVSLPSSNGLSTSDRVDNQIEVKVNHGNTVFAFRLKAEIGEIDGKEKGILGRLNFETVESSPKAKAEPIETIAGPKLLISRKLSFGCSCHDTKQSNNCCGSTSSTVGGSEAAMATQASEIKCNIEGSLTISEELLDWNKPQGLKSYCMKLFIFSRDKSSRVFVRATPEIKGALKHLFLHLYSAIMQK